MSIETLPALRGWNDSGAGIYYYTRGQRQYQVQHWKSAGFYRALVLELPEYDEAGKKIHAAVSIGDFATAEVAYEACCAAATR